MSGKPYWNLVSRPDKSGYDLAAAKIGLGRTCPINLTRTQLRTRISPVNLRKRRGPDMSGLGARNVQQMPLEPG
jgi:hypothetical protein